MDYIGDVQISWAHCQDCTYGDGMHQAVIIVTTYGKPPQINEYICKGRTPAEANDKAQALIPTLRYANGQPV